MCGIEAVLQRPIQNIGLLHGSQAEVSGLPGTLPGAWIVALGLVAADAGPPPPPAATAQSASAIVVHSDGAVSVPAASVFSPPSLDGKRQPVRYCFGLPTAPPESRLLEDDTLPICRTSWVKDRIRYTETVLVTRLQEGDLMPAGQLPADAVLMVQVAGECLASEYAEAAAAFGVELGGAGLNLELRDGAACAAHPDTPAFVAAVDVPASGIENANGRQLRFRGNMPPGTSGSMTIKIPATAPKTTAQLDLLRDLNFDDELRRVKRSWKGRAKPGAAEPLPVAFGDRKD